MRMNEHTTMAILKGKYFFIYLVSSMYYILVWSKYYSSCWSCIVCIWRVQKYFWTTLCSTQSILTQYSKLTLRCWWSTYDIYVGNGGNQQIKFYNLAWEAFQHFYLSALLWRYGRVHVGHKWSFNSSIISHFLSCCHKSYHQEYEAERRELQHYSRGIELKIDHHFVFPNGALTQLMWWLVASLWAPFSHSKWWNCAYLDLLNYVSVVCDPQCKATPWRPKQSE